MRSPAILAAAQACLVEVLNWIRQHHPNAAKITFYRESGHGEWFNGVPEIYDADENPLTTRDMMVGDEESDPPITADWDCWNDSFNDAVGTQWSDYCDTFFDADDGIEFWMEIQDDKLTRIPKWIQPAPEVFDGPRFTFGVYTHDAPELVGKTVAEAKQYFEEKGWFNQVADLSKVRAVAGGTPLADAYSDLASDTKIEFFQIVREKGGYAGGVGNPS